ncbi:MAG: ribosome biogenesis GTPase Der [Desulfuromonadales bacterium]|nr:ribosome biogenesis GTPase Der [Desulfuromonadales bacterium]
MRPVVAIVGRPNVGKSTLFNRLMGTRKAIVDDIPGVTRDRNYGNVDRFDLQFTLIDTGGFEPASQDMLLQQMRQQSQLAMEEADIIIFLMDGRDGLTVADREVANMIRRVDKPVFFVVNKVDGDKLENLSSEFYALGVERIFTISAAHNRGVGELMDEVIAAFPLNASSEKDEDVTKIAVVGRPNVGKSTLVNKLLGFERSVANPVAGTTRDSIDTYFNCNRKRYMLIDTAGIRRKGRVSLKIETYSVVDALRSLERADVALIVIDAEQGITEQDTKIAGYAYEAGRSCLFVVNKWDSIEKNNATVGKFVEEIRMQFKYLSFAPIVFISAKTGQRTGNIMVEVEKLMEQYAKRISTSDLNRVFKEAVDSHHAPLSSGRRVKFYYATQVGTKPPSFVIFTNQPEGIHFSYERYLTNKIREAFGFTGTPIRLMFRGRDRRGK